MVRMEKIDAMIGPFHGIAAGIAAFSLQRIEYADALIELLGHSAALFVSLGYSIVLCYKAYRWYNKRIHKKRRSTDK